MSFALLLQYLAPIIVPAILAGAKKVAPRLPAKAIPIAAPFLGASLAGFEAIAANNPNNLWLGAALGLAGVGTREILDQIKPSKNGGWPDLGNHAK